ncbi:hypothetical protein GTA08_BOTSDO05509 [Botryosphaeria dothidea]|uniref:Uncharacterized protein n=1 Tax=Botryosphaeria dothidea TaxID=55169 RepID=A0A8H4ISS6_9PEZI|nr:hypothetical protein GTA08_BOTSDO05509 [Botryosphaeria dothidea]
MSIMIVSKNLLSASSAANSGDQVVEDDKVKAPQNAKTQDAKSRQKTQRQLDDELKAKMAGLSGDGGEAGIEYENGEPVAMKRSVRNNMFRYI